MPIRNKNSIVFSRVFLLIVGIIYFVNYIYANILPDMLSLRPNDVLDNLMIWKLLTFPFTPGTIEAMLLFAMTFYFISPKLEEIVDQFRYPSWLFLLSILHGCAMTLIFWKTDVVIAGMEGVAFFVLTLYLFLKPKSMVEFMKFPPLSTVLFTAGLIFLWFGMKIVNVTGGINTQFIPQFSSALFGITLGALIYLQIRLASNHRSRSRVDRYDSDLKVPRPEELSVALISNTKLKKQYRTLEDELETELYSLLSDDPAENEEKLNEILDKIAVHGKDSLSPYENRFLEEYSKQL
ncbi:MAG: rhomboid family intramembrane serine protease [Candidatus Kapabacteria bacterium]|nr:rhomboid family intramembrane serine protease [Candidatus Kapabacteria bacterium]